MLRVGAKSGPQQEVRGGSRVGALPMRAGSFCGDDPGGPWQATHVRGQAASFKQVKPLLPQFETRADRLLVFGTLLAVIPVAAAAAAASATPVQPAVVAQPVEHPETGVENKCEMQGRSMQQAVLGKP